MTLGLALQVNHFYICCCDSGRVCKMTREPTLTLLSCRREATREALKSYDLEEDKTSTGADTSVSDSIEGANLHSVSTLTSRKPTQTAQGSKDFTGLQDGLMMTSHV